MKSYYKILGVAPDATDKEIKAAYRKLAKEFHPDTHGGDKKKEKRFKEIQEAYATLSDEAKRRQYDYMGHRFYTEHPEQRNQYNYWSGFKGQYYEPDEDGDGHCGACDGKGHGHGHGHSHEDGHCGACGGEGHEHGHGHSHGDGHCGACDREGYEGGQGAMDDEDDFSWFEHNMPAEESAPPGAIRIACWVDMEDTMESVIKTAYYAEDVLCPHCMTGEVDEDSICPDCDGTGRIDLFGSSWGKNSRQGDAPCPKCKGRGRIPMKRCPVCRGLGTVRKNWELKIHLPKGCYPEQPLPLRYTLVDGEEFWADPNHDKRRYYIIILMRDKEGYTRMGYHVHTDFLIDYPTLVLGGEIHIPTLEGDYLYTIEPGHRLSVPVRLQGRGLYLPKKIGGRGDHYVHLKVDIPKALTPDQKSALAYFKSLMAQS